MNTPHKVLNVTVIIQKSIIVGLDRRAPYDDIIDAEIPDAITNAGWEVTSTKYFVEEYPDI